MDSVAEYAIDSRRRHARRVLIGFLAGSVAVHAVVLVVMPPLAHVSEPAKAGVLEVVILQPEPLPVALPEPVPQPPRLRKPEPARVPAITPPNRDAERPAPVLALSEPRPVTDGAFRAAPPPLPGLPPPVPELKPQVAGVAVAPPSFSAAYLRNPAPRYPVAARRAGEQGTVTLRVLVTRDGLPSRVDVEKGSGSPHLDAAALEAVKAWRFAPARRGDESIESWVLVPIVFRLEGTS